MLTKYQISFMLSVLIPIYQFEVFPLVASLVEQCRQLSLEFEVLLFDDGSSKKIKIANRQVRQFSEVLYEELPKNIGRSAIRNHLADRASYPYLLFMDCDSAVVRNDYIAKYLDYSRPDLVVCGGRIYQASKPPQQPLVLHWKSGQAKEVIAPSKRADAPYTSFMTNNFFAPKSIFNAIRFDEHIRWYGHEDTLFGDELAKQHIAIEHIDNPLMHIGLETAVEVLAKTEQAIENLILINQYNSLATKLTASGDRLIKSGVARIVSPILGLSRSLMEKHLLRSHDPKLWVLDLYKLGIYLQLKNTPKNFPDQNG